MGAIDRLCAERGRAAAEPCAAAPVDSVPERQWNGYGHGAGYWRSGVINHGRDLQAEVFSRSNESIDSKAAT